MLPTYLDQTMNISLELLLTWVHKTATETKKNRKENIITVDVTRQASPGHVITLVGGMGGGESIVFKLNFQCIKYLNKFDFHRFWKITRPFRKRETQFFVKSEYDFVGFF